LLLECGVTLWSAKMSDEECLLKDDGNVGVEESECLANLLLSICTDVVYWY